MISGTPAIDGMREAANLPARDVVGADHLEVGQTQLAERPVRFRAGQIQQMLQQLRGLPALAQSAGGGGAAIAWNIFARSVPVNDPPARSRRLRWAHSGSIFRPRRPLLGRASSGSR